MDQIRYSGRRFAEVLGLSSRELAAAEERGLVHSTLPPEGRGAAQKVVYSMEDLAAARVSLARVPPRRPMRRQLFLNFKGGTGKTSVSSSYAFRLAEMGHRVLVIDLDSRGTPPSAWASPAKRRRRRSSTPSSRRCRSSR